MSQPPLPVAARCYQFLSRVLLSGDHRRRYGRASLEAFVDLWADARSLSWHARVSLLAREAVALFALAARQRVTALQLADDPLWRPPSRPRLWLSDAAMDVRLALRVLRGARVYAVTAVVTIALGITCAAGTFALLRGTLLRPLPYQDPDALVKIWSTRQQGGASTTSVGDYLAWRETGELAELAAYNMLPVDITGEVEAERILGAVVTENFLDVLGVRPMIGAGLAGLDPDEAATVISHGLWIRQFAGAADILGRSLSLGGVSHRIVGVLPPEYRHPLHRQQSGETELLVRLRWSPEQRQRRDFVYLHLLGRLAPGQSVESTRARLDGVQRQVAAEFPGAAEGVVIASLREEIFGDLAPLLWLLQGASIIVFLVAFANVGNLATSHSVRRQGEFAVRRALGARRGRLLRQHAVESAILALGGAGPALVGVSVIADRAAALRGSMLPLASDPRIDFAVLGYMALLTAAFTALSAVLANRTPRDRAAQTTSTRVTERVCGRLVMVQVAATVALVIGASLLIRSLFLLTAQEIGFEPERVVAFTLTVPGGADDAGQRRAFFDEVVTALSQRPDVESVALTSDLPFTSENRGTHWSLEDGPFAAADAATVEYRTVSPTFRGVLGIRLLAGRDLGASDRDGEPVVLVNQRFASMHLKGDALGTRLRLDRDGSGPVFTVVGVVDNERDDGYAAEPDPMVYRLFAQVPAGRMFVLVRPTAGTDAETLGRLREALRAVARGAPVAAPVPMRQIVEATLSGRRLATTFALGFAVLALTLSSVGIYGLIAFGVGARLTEIGVRGALGAAPNDLIRMVVSGSLRLAVVGTVVGLFAGFAVGRALAAVLFGVGQFDAAALLSGPLVVILTALLAAWGPARRAARVPPSMALRS